jgi:hypothetical protein
MFPDSAATIAGVYREFAPPPDLAAHVACVPRRRLPGRERRVSAVELEKLDARVADGRFVQAGVIGAAYRPAR